MRCSFSRRKQARSTFVGRPARSACARAGVMTVSARSGWHVSQAYTLRAFMSQVLILDPHRPHVEWLYTYLHTKNFSSSRRTILECMPNQGAIREQDGPT